MTQEERVAFKNGAWPGLVASAWAVLLLVGAPGDDGVKGALVFLCWEVPTTLVIGAAAAGVLNLFASRLTSPPLAEAEQNARFNSGKSPRG